jgi:putative spermidine/putrescine transport system permease protein
MSRRRRLSLNSSTLIGRPGNRAAYLLVAPAFAFFTVAFFIPMMLLLASSFQGADTGNSGGITLANYVRFFGDDYYRGVLFNTIRLGLIVALVCVFLAYPLAYYIRSARGSERTYLTLLVLSPLLVSLVVRNFGWVIILGPTGLVNSALIALGLIDEPIQLLFTETAVLLGLIHLWLPFMVLAILSALHNIDPDLARAARTLGASDIRAFVLITLPLSVPGILAGYLIVFSLTVATFVTPAMLGGGRVVMMAQIAYDQTLFVFNWPFAAAVSFILLGTTTTIVLVANRMLTGRRFSPTGTAS